MADFRKNKLVNPYFIFTGSKESPIRSILIDCGFQIGPIKESVYSEPIPQNIELNLLVQKPGTSQNSIRLGKLLPARNHNDFFKINLLNLILGGYFGSRLMANIREDKGYTYGIGSGVNNLVHNGYFFISTEVGADVTNETLSEIYKELKTLREKPVDKSELETVRNYILGNFLRSVDGPFALADKFKSIWEFGLVLLLWCFT